MCWKHIAGRGFFLSYPLSSNALNLETSWPHLRPEHKFRDFPKLHRRTRPGESFRVRPEWGPNYIPLVLKSCEYESFSHAIPGDIKRDKMRSEYLPAPMKMTRCCFCSVHYRWLYTSLSTTFSKFWGAIGFFDQLKFKDISKAICSETSTGAIKACMRLICEEQIKSNFERMHFKPIERLT
jgi:hypothetical protein